MEMQQLRIRVHGRISQSTARALGLEVEAVDDGFELVCSYMDQAQLTGLLVQLSDLHIAFDRMEVCGPGPGRERESTLTSKAGGQVPAKGGGGEAGS